MRGAVALSPYELVLSEIEKGTVDFAFLYLCKNQFVRR